MNFSRRSVLGGALAGFGGVAATSLLAACGGDSGGGGGATADVTFGSNYSDSVPKAAMAAVLQAYPNGSHVRVNTVDHNSFQENINRYLQGNPDDVFCWFAGYRMQFFAKQGLAGDLSDVWKEVGGNFSDALKAASTGEDGKQYFLPFYNYPWGVFYRKSVWQQKGYAEPRTLDEFKALCEKMKTDGLVPVAFADKDGWPAMGTFDYLNMRINGYQFHVDLMAGKQAWTDAKLKTVFDTWRGLLPYHQPGANGRTWQEAAQSLLNKQSGMYVCGTFVGEQFPGADLDDLDFFAFPEISSEFGQDSVEAPIDGFMMAAKPKNASGAKELFKYLATGPAELAYLKSNPTNIAANSTADTSGYNALQKKSAQLVGSAKHISQFLDRDTRPDFASQVMIPALQTFINKPDDVDGLLKNIEAQKKTIFTS
ncbi:ABC transporter substrate-binding protein [Dactylosporangium salmoneum]|uniref:Extracellular solute-binding protein n=1 Tax=Dactylosporangium salmoneum TaxID=53361 RepID=A0ABP5S915_9ACTN